MYGPAFAANFVNPLDIGGVVTANPWFPLVTGNRWVYEGGDETIEVVVTDETKLIDGVTCVVVIDTVSEDGAALEITRKVNEFYGEVQTMGGGRWDTSSLIRRLSSKS